MVSNRRRGEDAIPARYEQYLNEDQREALSKLEQFGWSLSYVRRPKFEPVEIVLVHDNGRFAVLGEGGELERESDVPVRGDGEAAEQDSESQASTGASSPQAPTADTEQPSDGNQKEPPPSTGTRKPPKFLV